MRNHDSFGHSSGAAGIDKGAAVSRLDLLHPLMQVSALNPVPLDHELVPMQNLPFVLVWYFELGIIIKDDEPNVAFF